jgi:F-type H+-transporting ATPase subunit delta
MKTSAVSIRYAKALYELCKANKTNDKVFAEVRAFNQALENDNSINEFICSPLVGSEQKIKLLKGALSSKLSEELMSTLCLLAEKKRLDIFKEFVTAFEEISDKDHGVTRGTVRSATQLSPEARKKIEDTVNSVTGKRVILNFTEDEKIIGGMVAQVGGWTFDDSIDSHLTRLSEDLNRRAN